ncbi:hypothetical protein FE257_011313 [Aspergillus nanangensis]|uniref:Glycoprotease family protein n=1 Tax=Aspergillus nanangensis TaxID=2582783 RepID=A0AAD4GRH0_ASPNN|nr:hypothetical protein FE257_011313 [Aspergillus nanangensis]
MAPISHNQQSKLQIPTVPHFPLSSPITEEVPSPTSTSSDDRDLERRHPFQYLAKMAVPKPLSDKIEDGTSCPYPSDGDMQRRKNPKEKPLGLNLVTDFSRPPLEASNKTGAAAPTFVDLNDLKVLSKVREKERTAQTIKGILKKGTSHGFHRLPDEPSESTKAGFSLSDVKARISPKRRFKDDLSPSDRPIMIGFSVPREDSSESQKERPKELDSAGSQRTPLTPSIIVTPAKDDDFWPDFSQVHHYPRATSSIYSQPTPHLESNEAAIPPVPAIPAQHVASKAEICSPNSTKRQSSISTRKLRSYSTGTVFEEDDNWRPGTRPRSYSAESVKGLFDRLSPVGGQGRLSVTTDHNRHQSQGWWTYLLSPLLDRSNTLFSLKTPTSASRPPLPTPTTTKSGLSDEWWEKEISCFSPDTPETAVANRGEIPNGHNVDTNPFADTRSVADGQFENIGEKDETFVKFAGGTTSGAAAEYYLASAHELFSRKPYFECVDHVCSITPKDLIPTSNPDTTTMNEEGSRGLLVDVGDSPQPQHAKPLDPFDNPVGSGSRSLSGDTQSDKRDTVLQETSKGIEPPKQATEESDKGAAPVADYTGNTDKSASVDYQNEKQTPFPFLLPNGGPPPATQVYVQSAPAPSPAPMGSTEHGVPQYIVVQPPNYNYDSQPRAPDPVSPGFQRATEQTGSIPLGDIHNTPAPAYTPHRNDDAPLPPRIAPVPMAPEELTHPMTQRDRVETRRRRLEKEDAIGRKAGGLWRGRGPFSNRGCFGRPGREGRLRRRWYIVITAFFLAIVVVAVVLAIMLTRKGDETPVQSQWLNLTGYPPMPTGIATIAGPEAKKQNSGCIIPSTLWSCALPNEQQEDNKPYSANQPNFRMEIRFRNGTYPNSTTVASKTGNSLTSRDLFSPSPSPPDIEEQTFLGNTTDQNSIPFAGEVTPFYMTMLSPVPLSTLTKRSSQFPDIDSLIPSPALASDGTAADAKLYPLPESQPVRLYNRGQDNEHYGFYTYFDRSIFLESSAPIGGGETDDIKSDTTGGPSKEKARVRCTWSQTRFLVQIWTHPEHSGMSLLASGSGDKSTATATATPTSSAQPTNSSSANDFSRPGSFPYPVTITIDRHGGLAKEKKVYCYGMEVAQRVNETEKKLQIEDRGFGGTLIHAAPGLFNMTDEPEKTNGDVGGVDGGTGGCSCQWVNWIGSS